MRFNQFKIFFLLFSAVLLVRCGSSSPKFENPEQGFVSWKPAPDWEDALLSGNGTMGAMVFGDPHEETVIVNHALHYLPNWTPQKPIDQASRLEDIRNLLAEGRYHEAAEIPVEQSMKEGYGEKKWIDPFVPFCNLDLSMPAGNVKNYRRMVDFRTGEAIVEWKQDGERIQRSLFVSRPDSLIVMRIKGSDDVSASLRLRQHPVAWDQQEDINQAIKDVETSARDGYLTYSAEFGRKWGDNPDGFEGVARVVPSGGETSYEDDRMIVEGADEILVLIRVVPNHDFERSLTDELKSALAGYEPAYDELLNHHKKVHGDLFGRVKLDLGTGASVENLQSEAFVRKAREKTTPGVIEKQFDAARYNIISSVGTNPPNLQGIWSGTWTPPWSSGFTHDGNVEVAVSSLLPGRTPELLEAYMDYHERMMPYYRDNARRLFGARGIALPAHSSTHGWNIHFDEQWCLSLWTGGAGWASGILYDHYRYTGDKQYLKEHIYPFMKEIALFYEDFLFEGKDGKYVFSPSYSPENTPANSNSQATVDATMDVMIAKELLRNCIEAGRVLDEDPQQLVKWQEMLEKMPEYRINEDGALAEWIPESLEDNYSHRHVSHLYALFNMISPEFKNDQELMDAAAKAVELRMKHRRKENGGEMAFGLAQMGMIAANLGDAEITEEVIGWLSKHYWGPSLATYHNPDNLFNMDISGGFPAVVMHTLAYSEPGLVRLFPAKPESWESGAISGMALRGQVTMDRLQWEKEGFEVTLTSGIDQKVTLKFPELFENIRADSDEFIMDRNPKTNEVTLRLKKGAPVHLQSGKSF